MSKTTVTLPEKFDIGAVTNIKSRLDKAVEKDVSVIEINAQNVEVLDSSAIQLLLSFQNYLRTQDKELQIIKSSEQMLSATTLLGADGILVLA